MAFVICIIIVMLATLQTNTPAVITPVYNAWGNCVLQHYNGTDNSWVPACGSHPSIRLPVTSRMLQILFLSGNSIVVSVIVFPSTFSFMHRCYVVFSELSKETENI